MRKKIKQKKAEWCPKSEKDYWVYYETLCMTYKAINLGKWIVFFTEEVVKDKDNLMAQNMLKSCLEKQKELIILKQESDKKLDEQLKIPDFSSKRKKK